ncbi:hypothetical protein GN956_G22891 [Arapaima gigas]
MAGKLCGGSRGLRLGRGVPGHLTQEADCWRRGPRYPTGFGAVRDTPYQAETIASAANSCPADVCNVTFDVALRCDVRLGIAAGGPRRTSVDAT